ncbi:MAG: winged helix-turn-helix domain-containing protein [bacterium]
MTINKFISSKVRVKIIKQFIFHPRDSYHIRELVRILKDEVNAVRRELINMEKAGLLKSQRESNRICYSINPNYYAYTEIRAMWHKEYGLGAQILKNKKQLGNISFILLTYTFLTLSESSENDLDLIVIGEPDERILEAIVKNAEDDLKKDIFYTVISEKDWYNKIKRKDSQAMSSIILPHVLLMGDPTRIIE